VEKLITKESPLLSKHTLLHQQGHDGDWRGDNHSILILYATDGWVIVETLCEKPHMYSITTPTEHTLVRSLLAVSKSIAAKSLICHPCSQGDEPL